MEPSAILDAFYFRHACKEFDPSRSVSAEAFAAILEAGRLSPSSFGFEPWQFVVIQNRELRERIRTVTWGGQKQLPTASHVVAILARTKEGLLPDSAYLAGIMNDVRKIPAEVQQGIRDRYRHFLVSDFKLIDNERALFEWTCRQTYIALGNMMTVAALMGIDSCPIEGFDKERAEDILREAGILKGSELALSCMVCFGYRVNEPRPKSRRPIDQVAEWIE